MLDYVYKALFTSVCLSAFVGCGDLWAAESPAVKKAESRVPSAEKIESAGAVVGEIRVVNRNIFDLTNPLEDKWLFRWANRLHTVTRKDEIESQLLFLEGDTYSKRIADESERILRRNNYLLDAKITPIKYADGVVDLEVETHDVWTLTPELSASRGGGENRYGFGLLEQNLFGRGITVGGQFKSTVDRDILFLEYTDNNFLRDRYRFALNYSDNSDGFFRAFDFSKPFYALDSRQAGGILYSAGEQIDQLYDRGDVVAEFNHRFDFNQLKFGVSRGLRDGWVRRYSLGLGYDRDEFSPNFDPTLPVTVLPDDREFTYPFFEYELVQDRFETATNFDQIHRTEDRFLGTFFSFRIGYSDRGTGSSANAWHYNARFSSSPVTTKRTSLTIGARIDGRHDSNGVQNGLISGALRFHRRIGENQLFYASLSGSAGRNLDIDNPLLLGGERGLRGYPLRYQNGDSKALLTVEHRLYTEWYPFRLAHVGAAIFFDAGRVWGDSPVGAPNLGLLKNVGVGLRLGNTRSGNGRVLHLDLAFPLDGEDDIDKLQILVDAKGSF